MNREKPIKIVNNDKMSEKILSCRNNVDEKKDVLNSDGEIANMERKR